MLARAGFCTILSNFVLLFYYFVFYKNSKDCNDFIDFTQKYLLFKIQALLKYLELNINVALNSLKATRAKKYRN